MTSSKELRRRQDGSCAMRGSCGFSYGKPVPCPYDGAPSEPEDDEARELLRSVCGAELAAGPVCCTSSQVRTLRDNFGQVETILGSCPACRNNFRDMFCAFTCSSTQGHFVNVTSTQGSERAVDSVDFSISESFASGLYDSCKNVQLSASNMLAMTVFGGAHDYQSFLSFLGTKGPLSSPFQIDFAYSPPHGMSSYSPAPRDCAGEDISNRCSCVDCPSICPTLPPVAGSEATCHVGIISCLTFVLTLAYGLAVVAFIIGYVMRVTLQRRRIHRYERLVLSSETASNNVVFSPTHPPRGLIGASSLTQTGDDDSSGNRSTEVHHLGRGASLLDPLETLQPRQYRLNTLLRQWFYKLGLACASSPWLTFALVFALMAAVNSGWSRFSVERDPVNLWVAPNSESKSRKEYFDQQFGPFYRTEQIFLSSAPSQSDVPRVSLDNGPLLTWERLKWWAEIESEIRSLRSSPNGYSLQDVCFKPQGPRGACVVQSMMAWYGDDIDNFDEDTWKQQLLDCSTRPGECRPAFEQPIEPQHVLGGAPVDENGKRLWLDSPAAVITYVVSNSLNEAERAKAEEFEMALRNYLQQISNVASQEAGIIVSFSTGISLEEELNASTNTDMKIVVLSYLVMFLYVSLTLGSNASSGDETTSSSLLRWAKNFPKLFSRQPEPLDLTMDMRDTPTILPRLPNRIFVSSKVTLALFGIMLVILSVSSSVGFFSIVGVKVTLIIAEVIPFLILAVGVDNVFILVHELERQNARHGAAAAETNGLQSQETPMSPTQSHRSPFGTSSRADESIDIDAVAPVLQPETRIARSLAKMGPSILLSTTTETVAFALGALVPMPAVRNFALYAAGSVLINAFLQVTVFVSALSLDLRRAEANRVDCIPCFKVQNRIALLDRPSKIAKPGHLSRFVRKYYAPFLTKPTVKAAVLLIFSAILCLSVISMQHIQLGFDQALAFPRESYLVQYFDALREFYEVGPPVFFVSRNVDITERAGQRHLCGRFTTCDIKSIPNILEAERQREKTSYIAQPTAVWIDDFFNWLSPEVGSCCRIRKADPSEFCGPHDRERFCQPCFFDRTPAWNSTMNGFPEGAEFMRYLKHWLESPTNEECPLAGQASFGAALSLNEEANYVTASHFRTFNSPLRIQDDFINAFLAADRIAAEMSADTGTDVFPYSVFHIFFDQYAHVVAITQEVLGLGLAAVLVVTALLLGSWRTATIVTATVAATVVTCMGIMGVWGISLNAISLVNLVISLGIAVEFCAHIARAFMGAGTGLTVEHAAGQKERDERMCIALVDVGPSVLSGITFTKLIGVSVLALTRSRLLEIYYFRMWFSLIISGALHGLVLLPVILSYAGGPGYALEDADEEWMSNAVRRREYEYAPFLADDDSVHSD